MTTRKATAVPEPPTQAVAADAHWAATRDRLRNRNRPVTQLTICDDPERKQRLSTAQYALRRITAEAADSPGDKNVKAAVAAAQADVDIAQGEFNAVAIVLRFQALRKPDFEALKTAHKPTEEQAENDLVVNIDTIGPDLISQSSLDGITADDARDYLEEWAEGEAAALFSAAWNIQGDNSRMDLGKG